MSSPDNLPPGDPDFAAQARIGRWFLFSGLLFCAGVAALAVLVRDNPQPFRDMGAATARFFRTFKTQPEFLESLSHTTPAAKLLFLALYLSLCTTFIPLPSGALVTLMATQGAGVSDNLAVTTLLVAGVGAAASTIANLNDYHLFLLLLRHHHVAKLRHTRLYRSAALWFAKSPFAILVVFSILPIPVDVSRMLAAAYGYRLTPFAIANFVGRFLRYGVFAVITFLMGKSGWIAPVAMLGVALAIALVKAGPWIVRHVAKGKAPFPAAADSRACEEKPPQDSGTKR